jgi:hypothetical protein
LIDLLDLLDSGPGPSTSRGTLALSLLLSVGLAAINGWLLLSSDRPLHEPQWGMNAIIFGILFGAMSAILGVVHLTRYDDEVVLAWGAIMSGIVCLTMTMTVGFAA